MTTDSSQATVHEKVGSRRRRYTATLLLLVTGLVVSCVLLELGARLVYPRLQEPSFTWTGVRQRLQQQNSLTEFARGNRNEQAATLAGSEPHPYLGYAMDPDNTIEMDGRTVHPFSQIGFIRGALPLKNDPNEIVVGFSGGSVAAGVALNSRERIEKILEADPRFAGKKVRIENYSLAGYKQPQALLALNYFLVLGAHFDMWINLDGFNEVVLPVSENMHHRVAAVYPRGWQTRARSRVSEEELLLRAPLYALAKTRDGWRSRINGSPLNRSAFVMACWDILDKTFAQQMSDADAALQAWDSSQLQQKAYGPFAGDLVSEREMSEKAARIWIEASAQMNRLCTANGIQYFHFIQPNQYYEGTKPLNEEEKRIAWTYFGYRPAASQGYPLLLAGVPELQAEGVRIFDITMMFSEEPRTIYIDSCCHFSQLANDLVADRIGAEILASMDPLAD